MNNKNIFIYELQNGFSPFELDFLNDLSIIKNEKVIEYYKNIPRYLPYDSYMNDLYDVYLIPNKCLFYYLNENKLYMITKSFLTSNPLMKTIIDRHIKHHNYLINDSGFSKLCDLFGKRSIDDFYNMIDQPDFIKTKLFDYQRDNIKWMTEREKKPLDFFFIDHKFCIFNDERIYDYYLDDFVPSDFSTFDKLTIQGGILMDDVGIGKTIQAICCVLLNPVPTLIIVPNHLEQYWQIQVMEHVQDVKQFYETAKITTFDRVACDLIENIYQRIIVDEIHEIFTNNFLLEHLLFYKCPYKWGLTATPWTHTNSLTYLFTFLTNHKFIYSNSVRMNQYYSIYNQIFRRNDKSNIQKEVHLPNINVFNVLIQFSDVERNIYEIEKSANEHCHINFLRELCGCIDMNTDFYTSQMITNHFENSYLKEKEILDNYEKIIHSLEETLRHKVEIEVTSNWEYYKNLYSKQERVVYNRLRAFERYQDGLQKIENLINNNNSEECIICFQEMNNKIAYYKCGHYFCFDCIFVTRRQNDKCPYCRIQTKDDELYVITKKKNQKYNSKINRMLDLINSKNEKFIIYTQFEKVMNLLSRVFVSENKKFKIANRYSDILNDNYELKEDYQILLLNNVSTASGLDLSFFNNIIIFEPFQDEKSWKQIEHQMIGRIYRIGQKYECNVYRLIINNSIESDLYMVDKNR
jgi:SNF2 family DNA or RNA helicase